MRLLKQPQREGHGQGAEGFLPTELVKRSSSLIQHLNEAAPANISTEILLRDTEPEPHPQPLLEAQLSHAPTPDRQKHCDVKSYHLSH